MADTICTAGEKVVAAACVAKGMAAAIAPVGCCGLSVNNATVGEGHGILIGISFHSGADGSLAAVVGTDVVISFTLGAELCHTCWHW